MENLQVIKHPKFGQLSVIIIDGKEYFKAKECAFMLGYKDTVNAVKQHCKGVVKHHLPSKSGEQTFNLIPEGDLWRLIIRSKLPQAEQIEKWIMDEVLPTIRKTGAYGTPEYEQLRLEDKPYEYVDKFYKGMPVLTCKDIEHFSEIHRSTIAEVLRSHCENGKDYILLSGEDMRSFKKENANYPVNVPNLYIVLKSGFDKVAKHFNIKCESMPKMMIEEKRSNTRGVANESTCRLMSYIRREIKGVEALTYLLESNMDLDDFMSLKRILENKLKAIGGWRIDTSGIKLGVHSPSASEMNAIYHGTRGIRHI